MKCTGYFQREFLNKFRIKKSIESKGSEGVSKFPHFFPTFLVTVTLLCFLSKVISS